MTGDEAGLGTPVEDMSSLCAVSAVDVPQRYVACIGFGVDAYHGVCHAHFLENVAALERDGGYLGAFSVSRHTDEGEGFLDAVVEAQRDGEYPSIVNGSITAAVRGEFGDVQFTTRTRGSELFINPLMGLYFTFQLSAVAMRSRYLSALEGTQSAYDVRERIELYRDAIQAKPFRPIPH
jgi:hypothetical protein